MALWQRIRRLFHRTPAQQSSSSNKHEYMSTLGKSVLDVNKALQWAYDTGAQNERQHRPPLYGTVCPKHDIPLRETDPGHFICIIQHEPQQTQPLPIAHTGDFARIHAQLTRARGMPPGEDTIRMAALTLRQKEPPQQS